MQNKFVKVLLSLTIAASMAAGAPMAALASDAAAEETTAAETAAEETTEAGETSEEETGADFEITVTDGTVSVKNETTRKIASAVMGTTADVKAAEDAEGTADEEGTAEAEDGEGTAEADGTADSTDADSTATDSTDTESTTEAAAADTEATADEAEAAETADAEAAEPALILTEEDGTQHAFVNAAPEDWTDPVLTESYGFLYITYTDKDGKEQEAVETADEQEFDEPVTMYATTDVHVRKEANKDSESVKVASLGEEYTVTGAAPGWYKVESGDISGYVFHNYLTDDKEAVDALVKAKEEADAAAAAQAAADQQAAAAAAAQAAAEQQAAAAAAQQQQAATSQAVTEVSRQKYDDCDGSGHGYYEITWSDGSVTYENY